MYESMRHQYTTSNEVPIIGNFLLHDRLYTEEAFNNEMRAESVPEIQRSSLTSTILQVQNL